MASSSGRRVRTDGPSTSRRSLGEDRAKQRDAFGALDAPLARHLDGLADDELVPVAIWLVEPERQLGKRPEEGAGQGTSTGSRGSRRSDVPPRSRR